jgi:hypothetical protein
MSTEHTAYPDPSAQPALDAGHWFATSRGVDGEPVSTADATAGVFLTDAPGEGRRIVLHDLLLSAGEDAVVLIVEEVSGKVIHGPLYLAEFTTVQITLRGSVRLPEAGRRLRLVSEAAGRISAEALYHAE